MIKWGQAMVNTGKKNPGMLRSMLRNNPGIAYLL